MPGQLDIGWAAIFAARPILQHIEQHGYYDIAATEIKALSHKEPRIMAKIDFRENLPAVMAANHLAILAIGNGLYRIGRFDPFINLQEECRAPIQTVDFPPHIITLNPQCFTGESGILDAAHLSGFFQQVFGETTHLTIRGRCFCSQIDYRLNNVPLPIRSVQIEVDGGYEGPTTINLIEAKNGSRGNISIRQLVYPHLSWQQIVGDRKTVRTFLVFHQDSVTRFIPILIGQEGVCADHANERAFRFGTLEPLRLESIEVAPDAPLPDRRIPFPQADRFDKVLALFAQVAEAGSLSKEELFSEFDLCGRQTSYYLSVLRWIGLCDYEEQTVSLSEVGRRIAGMTRNDRMRRLAEIIFAEPVFHHVVRHGIEDFPEALFYRWNVRGSTVRRRLQTVIAWLRFFQDGPER